MKLIDALASRRGRAADVSRALGIAPGYLSQMANGVRPVPEALAPALERELAMETRRWDLRPDDWHRIWPELIGTRGAPPVAPTAAAPSHYAPPLDERKVEPEPPANHDPAGPGVLPLRVERRLQSAAVDEEARDAA